MNTVIIWNDHVPVNAKEMVDYAHSCGIKVIWGYSWLWGTDCNVFLKDGLKYDPKEYLEKYENEYAHTGCDGIKDHGVQMLANTVKDMNVPYLPQILALLRFEENAIRTRESAGDITIQAGSKRKNKATTDASAAGSKVAVGAAISIGVVNVDTVAVSDRVIANANNVTISAVSANAAESTATAMGKS